MGLPSGSHVPHTPLLEVRDTPNAGRGVFALQDIPAHTPLLSTNFVPLAVILREYRREVCGHCFGYARGTHWKLRDAATNFSFCGAACCEAWKAEAGELGVQAWSAVETFVRNKAGKGSVALEYGAEEPTDEQGDTAMGDYPRRPALSEIDTLWTSLAGTAHFIGEARAGSRAKPHRRSMQAALDVVPHADVLYFLTAGALLHHGSTTAEERRGEEWNAFMALAEDRQSYQSMFHLRRHVHSYLQLLALLPVVLLPSVTQAVCREIASHDAHNAFGIRSLEDEGSEFFGWGVWPQASYFNHSCASNVGKDRSGRRWRFWTRRDVQKGEELCISYLGGDENDLGTKARGERTLSTWGFVCGCQRCRDEKVDS